MFLNYISIPIFFVSFIIGLLFIYILGPDTKTIYVYPSPETVDKYLYKDKADNCFHMEEKIITCPNDDSLISNIPLQY